MLKVKFVGAIEGVSGSCTWMHHTDSDTQFLIDCGLNQGSEREQWANTQAFPFQARQLKYVLLTHAHIDHCGQLPRLVRERFSGFVYATRATRDLTEAMLLDAARVGKTFTEQEIKQIRWSILDDDAGFIWGRNIRLAEGVWMAYLRSSHILGACSISISWKAQGENRSICFSGDVGCQSDANPYLPLMKSGQHPFAASDFIVVESTYGSRVRTHEHQNADMRLKRLGEVIAHTLFTKRGKVLLPAFSLHRTQELMMDVLAWMKFGLTAQNRAVMLDADHSTHPLTACVHAPLGRLVTGIYAKHLCARSPNGKFKYLNSALCDRLDMSADAIQAMLTQLVEGGNYSVDPSLAMTMVQPKQPSRFDSDVIIASAGMCDHGPVVSYLDQWDNDPRNTVVLTGYQSQASKGAELMRRSTSACVDMWDLAQNKAEVIDMSPFYSAHADQAMLLDFVFRMDGYCAQRPATVLLNHGNPDGKYAFRQAIEQRASELRPGDRSIAGVRVADARWINLNTGEAID